MEPNFVGYFEEFLLLNDFRASALLLNTVPDVFALLYNDRSAELILPAEVLLLVLESPDFFFPQLKEELLKLFLLVKDLLDLKPPKPLDLANASPTAMEKIKPIQIAIKNRFIFFIIKYSFLSNTFKAVFHSS